MNIHTHNQHRGPKPSPAAHGSVRSLRDQETLSALRRATERNAGPGRNGWVRPMDIGGRNGSHHSATLSRLVKLGFAEERRRCCSVIGALGSSRAGKLYRYRAKAPNDEVRHSAGKTERDQK